MNPHLALIVYGGFILWLFVREHKYGPPVSSALWLPFLWMFVLGSRPITLWLALGGARIDSSVDYSEGTPADRFVFLCLLIAGLMVLSKRNFGLGDFIRSNRCLCLFYLFWGVSVFWSPDSFVSFKRWIKELGNVVMVLVILTDANPLGAVKTVLSRLTYLLVPLSVLFIKYFPDLGRVYNHWTWLPSVTGVTTEKNALGELIFILVLTFVWIVLDPRLRRDWMPTRLDICLKSALALMMFWIMVEANSATSLLCTILGISLLLLFRLPKMRNSLRHFEIYVFVFVLLVGLFNTVFPLSKLLVHGVGRDLTLTDRTLIWQRALEVDRDPVLGTGFYSFWLTPASERITDEFKGINQVHNGYLETYMNGGIVAVVLLALVLIVSYRHIKRDMMNGNKLAFLCFAFYVATLVHNITEASFNRVDIIWFILLLAIIEVPALETSETEDEPHVLDAMNSLNGETDETQTGPAII